jgi:hypothetical protein
MPQPGLWRSRFQMRFFSGNVAVVVTSALLCGAASQASTLAPSGGHDFASGDAVRAQVAAMLADMKPGQGFAWRPLVQDGPRVVAIEIWKKPGRPAMHPTEAEYVVVLEGAGTLVTGGTLVAPVTRAANLVEGEARRGRFGPVTSCSFPQGCPTGSGSRAIAWCSSARNCPSADDGSIGCVAPAAFLSVQDPHQWKWIRGPA